MHKVAPVIILMMFCLFSINGSGQIDLFRTRFIEALSKDIYKYYVSEELARQMIDYIKLKYANGNYDSSLNADEFAFEVALDLRKISKDKHISVTPLRYDYFDDSVSHAKRFEALSPRQLKKIGRKKNAVKRLDEEYMKRTKNDMFAYGDIKILPGNVGYIEIFNFQSTSWLRKENKKRIAISSVFRYLRNTSSIIIDLRENLGGSVGLAAKFCSYFSEQPNTYFITT